MSYPVIDISTGYARKTAETYLVDLGRTTDVHEQRAINLEQRPFAVQQFLLPDMLDMLPNIVFRIARNLLDLVLLLRLARSLPRRRVCLLLLPLHLALNELKMHDMLHRDVPDDEEHLAQRERVASVSDGNCVRLRRARSGGGLWSRGFVPIVFAVLLCLRRPFIVVRLHRIRIPLLLGLLLFRLRWRVRRSFVISGNRYVRERLLR